MKWPKLIATTVRAVWLVEDGVPRVIHSSERSYYGLTWSSECLYAGCSVTDSRARVLMLDHALRLVGVRDFPARYPHQILWHDGRLLVTLPESNGVSAFDFCKGTHASVYSSAGCVYFTQESNDPVGEDHTNSIWIDASGRFYVCDHRQSVRFDRPSRVTIHPQVGHAAEARVHVGRAAHNCYEESGVLYVCDSLGGALVGVSRAGEDRLRVDLGAFTRGLSRPESGGWVVGLSPVGTREERANHSGWLVLLDDNFAVAGRVELPGRGGLHDVRTLDVVDRAHSRAAFVTRSVED